jgi:fatty-acyl-CoA synthase
MDGVSIFEMLRDEDVSFTAGVPTVWLQVQQHMKANNLRLRRLQRLSIGGAAPPSAMFEAFARMGIPVSQGWGMTEMGPIGSIGMLKPPFGNLTGDERISRLSSQGVTPFLVEMKITDDRGDELPRDGVTPDVSRSVVQAS